jgi:hypothetical protein
MIFRDKPWLYGGGAVIYILSIGEALHLINELKLIDSVFEVTPFVYAALVFTRARLVQPHVLSPKRGYGDWATSMDWIDVGFLRLSHVLVLSIASSVLVNIIVSGSIAFRVMCARRRWSKLKTDLVNLQSVRTISDTTILTILFEAALPPAILGVIVCGISLAMASADQPTYTHSVRTLWLSLTVSCKSESPYVVSHLTVFPSRHFLLSSSRSASHRGRLGSGSKRVGCRALCNLPQKRLVQPI